MALDRMRQHHPERAKGGSGSAVTRTAIRYRSRDELLHYADGRRKRRCSGSWVNDSMRRALYAYAIPESMSGHEKRRSGSVFYHVCVRSYK